MRKEADNTGKKNETKGCEEMVDMRNYLVKKYFIHEMSREL